MKIGDRLDNFFCVSESENERNEQMTKYIQTYIIDAAIYARWLNQIHVANYFAVMSNYVRILNHSQNYKSYDDVRMPLDVH